MPAAEQALPEKSGHVEVGPIDQRRGPDDAGVDVSTRLGIGDQLFRATLAPGVGTESLRTLRERRWLRLALPEGPGRTQHRNTADVHEAPDRCGLHGAQQLASHPDGIALVRVKPAGGFSRRMYDNLRAGEDARLDLVRQIGADPLIQVRIIRSFGAPNATNPEAPPCQFASDRPAEEPAGASDHRQRTRTIGRGTRLFQ